MKTTNPLITLLSAPRTSSGGGSALHADAWKKAMEDEQLAAMQRARSVLLGERAMPENRDSQPSVLSITELPPHESSRSPAVYPAQFDAPISSMAAAQEMPISVGSSVPSVPPTNLYASMANPLIENAIDLEQSCFGLIACIAERFDRKWPLRNVHIERADDGVTIWIRDAKLAEDATGQQIFIERMKGAARDDGLPIARIMINGQQVY